MPKVLIIGDDMTGVNSSAVLLARQGLKCATFFDLDAYVPQNNKDLDVVIISTDSRSIEPEIAYQRVNRAMKVVNDDTVKLINKRMDSTLRGNIGIELKGILDNSPPGTLALVVPVFPASGRVCIGGYLMVNQVPLERTIVAKDPKNPIKTSKVVPLFAEQMQEPIGFIELRQVLQGEEKIANAISEQYATGCRVIVVDATTDDDVLEIAKAAKKTNIPIVSVDPGPFTSAMAMQLIDGPNAGMGQKVMLTVGSVSDLTRRQMEDLRLKYSHNIVNVSVLQLIDPLQRNAEIDRVVNALTNEVEKYEVLGVTTSSWERDVLNLGKLALDAGTTEDEISQRIAKGLAVITIKVITKLGQYVGGLFTSGGDVTVAVCSELKATCIEIKDEVLPLAVYGRIQQGIFHNRPIVTKGGLIGDDKAISKCVDYMLIKLSNESYTKI
ncbi:MAG: type effector Hrp-dependent outer [Firmicutes bacterium]|nr:type effector Hrp-dependent outer [Bacillota bacterium]